jgi:predicted Zn-dependent peptidase
MQDRLGTGRTSCLLIAVLVSWGLSTSPVRASSLPTNQDTTQETLIDQADPRQMTFPPVVFTPPEPERVVLDNGLVVYLLEDHELPLVTVTALLKTGGWLDPPDKVGLAEMMGETMRTGGTQRMTADEVDRELEQMAALVTISIGTESGSAMLDVLAKDLPRGLRLFAELLMTPAFDPARVELAKLQAIEAIRRRYDRPQAIAGHEFAKLLYGREHPYARESTVQSVSNITRGDLVAFHAKTVHPNGTILGVTGDFDRTTMLSLIKEIFGSWEKGEVPEIMLPAAGGVELTNKPVVRFVSKETVQAHIRVGQLTVKENDPDYPAVVLLNDILGGSAFRSRLFNDVRTKRGLAYAVGSVLQTGVRERGAWVMRAETKVESVKDVISRLVANMVRLREEPVSDEELAQAKDAFMNSFVFSFATPSAIVARLMGLEYDGLPRDFLEQLRDRVMALTKDDLLAAARRHVHPEQLRILAVGPSNRLAPLLAAFGEAQEITLPRED